ncbi:MAG: molecular chaperone HtpG, partial [Treponema sp.]
CRNSPHLESYKAKGIEVLIMAEDIDDIVIPTLGKYKDFELKAANRLGSDEELSTDEEKAKAKEKEEGLKPLLEKVQEALKDEVKEVRLSKRLSDSPSCIVIDDKDPSLQMERMMKAMGRNDYEKAKPILEINGEHAILSSIKESEDKEFISDVSHVLLDQALLAEKRELSDVTDFIKRLNRILVRGVKI